MCVNLYGNEHNHMTLRSSVAHYMESAIINNSTVYQTLRHHIIDVSTNKVWVGEDMIATTVD